MQLRWTTQWTVQDYGHCQKVPTTRISLFFLQWLLCCLVSTCPVTLHPLCNCLVLGGQQLTPVSQFLSRLTE